MDMFDSRSALPMLIGVESGPFDDEACETPVPNDPDNGD